MISIFIYMLYVRQIHTVLVPVRVLVSDLPNVTISTVVPRVRLRRYRIWY